MNGTASSALPSVAFVQAKKQAVPSGAMKSWSAAILETTAQGLRARVAVGRDRWPCSGVAAAGCTASEGLSKYSNASQGRRTWWGSSGRWTAHQKHPYISFGSRAARRHVIACGRRLACCLACETR
jgi:hypothetical protein